MANWCNARLVAVGPRSEVLKFGEKVRRRPNTCFRPDMLIGEAQELFAERIEKLNDRLAQKMYVFQVRNGDGCGHFRKLSTRFAKLRFVLVYADPNSDDFGSYFLHQGRSKEYLVSDRLKASIMTKHHAADDADDDDAYWEATWELMDLAQRHWKPVRAKPRVDAKSKDGLKPGGNADGSTEIGAQPRCDE